MIKSPWINDLAKAYDEKYTILEEARIEYDREVRALLEAVASAVRAAKVDSEVEQIVQAPKFVNGDPGSSGRCTLEYSVPVVGTERTLLVSAWFSSPWHDVPGYLYVAILAPDFEIWRAARLRAFGQSNRWSAERDNVVHGGPMDDDEGIYAEAVNLSDPSLVTVAAETIHRLLSLARDALPEVRTQYDLELRMEEMLVKTKHWLRKHPSLANLPEEQSFIGTWEGQRFVQLSFVKGLPDFWIGYHAERGTLMFGHNNPNSGSDFTERMRSALRVEVGCQSFERYRNEPSGTLINRAVLCAAPDADIFDTVSKAFDAYIRIISQGTEAAQ